MTTIHGGTGNNTFGRCDCTCHRSDIETESENLIHNHEKANGQHEEICLPSATECLPQDSQQTRPLEPSSPIKLHTQEEHRPIVEMLTDQRERGRGYDGIKLEGQTRKRDLSPFGLRDLRSRRFKKSIQAFYFSNITFYRENTFCERVQFVAKP